MNNMQLDRVVEELITNVDVCKIVNDNAERHLQLGHIRRLYPKEKGSIFRDGAKVREGCS